MSGFWLNTEYTLSVRGWNKARVADKGEKGLGTVRWLGKWGRHFSASNFFESLLYKHKWMAQLPNIILKQNKTDKNKTKSPPHFTPSTAKRINSFFLPCECTVSVGLSFQAISVSLSFNFCWSRFQHCMFWSKTWHTSTPLDDFLQKCCIR